MASALSILQYDGQEFTTHWGVDNFIALMNGLKKYIKFGRSNKEYHTINANPELFNDLPGNHPHNTIFTCPKITPEEIGGVTNATEIGSLKINDRVGFLELYATYKNNRKVSIVMHEYIAFCMYYYLEKIIQGFSEITDIEAS